MESSDVMRMDGDTPVYRLGRAPEGLATRKQLHAMGLSPAGLKPVAWMYYNRITHAECPLFDPQQARPKRQLTEAQVAALAKGRELAGTFTCSRCGMRQRVRHSLREEMCDDCGDKEEADQERQLLAWMTRQHRNAVMWARGVLADPEAVVLDTETTGLDADARLVQVAILHVQSGAVLLDTLVNPECSIPSDATMIHGITDACVQSAPTAREVLKLVSRAIQGQRVVIYNKAFDYAVLRSERARVGLPPWARGAKSLECAMEQYSAWVGECWEPGDYVWQPLLGDHSAIGDCHAVVRRLREMAADANE